jgi:hypothetical protein
MAKTIVSSNAIAASVDPKTRDYIDAKLNETLKQIRDDMTVMREALSGMRTKNDVYQGEVTARVNAVEEVLELSGAKVARIRKLMEDIDG